MRTLPGQTTATQVNNTRTNGSRGWRYSFNRRVMPDGSEKPLIKYDERGRLISYQVTEQTPGYYTQLESLVTGGDVTDTQLYNEPFKVKVQVEKTDSETRQSLERRGVFCLYVEPASPENICPIREPQKEQARLTRQGR